MKQLHGRKVHIAQGGHDVRQTVLDGKLRRRAGGELIIDRFIFVIGRNVHLVIVPLGALLFGVLKGPIHQPLKKRFVAVHKSGELAEGRQNQVFLDLFDLPEGDNIPAHGIIAHDSDAVVSAARAVVKVFLPAQVRPPVREKFHILPLHPLPDGLALRFRIMQGNLRLNLLFAGFGIQHMAAAIELQFVVSHRFSFCRLHWCAACTSFENSRGCSPASVP